MTKFIFNGISFILAMVILFTSCSSSTTIMSVPDGARLYLDGETMGVTPFTMRDTKIIGTCTEVRLEKEGYQTTRNEICRDEEVEVGAIIAGVFVLIPFFWAMKYKPTHTYELRPNSEKEMREEIISPPKETTIKASEIQPETKSKGDRLRDLKKLLDEGILTEQEFDTEKKKILDEE